MIKYVEPIGERIRRLRLVRYKYLGDKNCTVDAFGNKAGISRETLKQIESGRVKNIDPKIYKKISEALDVSIDYILTGEKTIDDEGKEEILFLPQVGSMIHARRIKLKNEFRDTKEYSVKSISKKLDITDMALLRIEGLINSKHLKEDDNEILKKLSGILQLELEEIKEAASNSFPQGIEKKRCTYVGKEIVIIFKEDSKVIKSDRFPVNITEDDYEKLIKRLEFELDII